MSDSYYELVDENDPQGEKIRRDRSGAQHVVGRHPARCTGVGPADPRPGALRATR